jgi:hypothetical protein
VDRRAIREPLQITTPDKMYFVPDLDGVKWWLRNPPFVTIFYSINVRVRATLK